MVPVYAMPTTEVIMARKSCTETRPCNLTTCYGCARKLIDELASHMIDNGASESAVNDGFRYPAINALARQIPAPAPKAPSKAHRGFTPKQGTNYQATADKLRVCGSRQYAALLLEQGAYTVAELDHIWSLAGRDDKIPSRLRKADRIEHLVEGLVGYRLDSEAIRQGARS